MASSSTTAATVDNHACVHAGSQLSLLCILQQLNSLLENRIPILFSSFPLLLALVVGGLGFEFCVFVAGWRHALRSEWPFIIIIRIPVARSFPRT